MKIRLGIDKFQDKSLPLYEEPQVSSGLGKAESPINVRSEALELLKKANSQIDIGSKITYKNQEHEVKNLYTISGKHVIAQLDNGEQVNII